MSVSLAIIFNMFMKFVLPYLMWVVLWGMILCNTTLRDDFYATLVWEILILSTESGIWVFCHGANFETANQGD